MYAVDIRIEAALDNLAFLVSASGETEVFNLLHKLYYSCCTETARLKEVGEASESLALS